MRLLLAYVGAFLTLAVLDGAWLGFIARDFYQSRVGDLLLPKPNWGVAALFYLAYPAGVVFFAVVPALDAGSLLRAALWGGLLGALAYGTYDLTNLATLKGWSPSVALLDSGWGVLATAAAAAAGFLLARLASPGA
jgi:uncharacterized membrane protein